MKCQAFGSDLRICLNRNAVYAYPDLTVVWGPLDFIDHRSDTLKNPKLIVEVLSPSTRRYDLGEKARMYLNVPTVTDLLLIDPEKIEIEHRQRLANGHWDLQVVQDRNATLVIESLGCEVPVAELYRRVDI